MPNHPFLAGQTYNRQRDIHGRFGGQERGGIATPTTAQIVFAFTSEAGAAYGYDDRFQPSGVFWYTGEGQVGDMQMVRGNAAIANHRQQGKLLLFFEATPSGAIRFLGEAEYLGHHIEQRPDRNGELRNALIFHIGFLPHTPTNTAEQGRNTYLNRTHVPSGLSLTELRTLALESASDNATPEAKLANVQVRSEAIRKYAIKRAKGKCEGCKADAPFKAKSGPFLEVHHVFRLADGGPDHPARVVALCPNCHKRAHYALDADLFNKSLIDWLLENESA